MPVVDRLFQVPKRGNSASEYEDAFAPEPPGAGHRFAIADGATESSHARVWADLLVAGFVASQTENWEEWIPPLQERWEAKVKRPNLSWYAEEKLELGAFAALLGLVLKDGEWHAYAQGDACLFHVRGNELLKAFPIEKSADFGTNPLLIGSHELVCQPAHVSDGTFEPGDRFLLATDAMARWLLQQHECNTEPEKRLWGESKLPATPEGFAAWVAELRETGLMQNDDVTLAIITT